MIIRMGPHMPTYAPHPMATSWDGHRKSATVSQRHTLTAAAASGGGHRAHPPRLRLSGQASPLHGDAAAGGRGVHLQPQRIRTCMAL